MSVNVTRNPAIGGGGGGGGASAADVAAAVIAALPAAQAPVSSADIAAAVVAAMQSPANVQAGQVVEFVAGSVPAGYAQVAGVSQVPAGAWQAAYPCIANGLPADAPIYGTDTKLHALVGTATPSLQPLNDDFSLDGAAVFIPQSYGRDHRLVKLSGNKLLRIGGYSSSSVPTSTYVHVYDQATRSWTALKSRTTAIGAHYAVEAGDGAVFVFNGTTVDRFYGNNWTEALTTAPATVLAVAKLPSGNIFVVCATAQYVFNTTTYQFSAVAQPFSTASVSGYVHAVSTPAGARVYDTMLTIGSVTQCIACYDYAESSGTTTYTPPSARCGGTTTYPSVQTHPVRLKDGGVLLKSLSTTQFPEALIHRVDYTPASTVKAVKQ